MSTDNGLLRANGVEMSWVDGGGLSLGLGIRFSVVPKRHPRVARFRGLQLVRRL